MRGNILVLDDEKHIFEQMDSALEAHNVYYLNSLVGVKGQVTRKEIDVIFVDLGFRQGDKSLAGLPQITRTRQRYPHVTIVVLSKYRDPEIIVQAVKNGADDYLWKTSWKPYKKEFRDYVNKLVSEKRTRDEARKELWSESWVPTAFEEEVHLKLRELAISRASFFVIGEIGTGKSQVTNFLRVYSLYDRSRVEHLRENLATYSEKELMRMISNKYGSKGKNIFRKARNRILQLDNLPSTSLDFQEAFWHFLRDQRFSGSNEPLAIQAVILLHESPEELMREKKLLPELFEGLDHLQLKALRHRKKAIKEILDQWLEKHDMPLHFLSKEIRMSFKKYDYPGNLSQFFGMLRRALEKHKEQHEGNFKTAKLSWEQLPKELFSPDEEFDNMKRIIAEVELSYLENAFQRFEGFRDQKRQVALLWKTTTDNLKKTYYNKYMELYPDLIQKCPSMRRAYGKVKSD